MRFELTLYDTEAREDRAIEYTQDRRRAAVWAMMPRVQLGGSFHHLVYRVREYSTGPKRKEIPLSQLYREQEKKRSEIHQRIREAKSLTAPQAQLLLALEEASKDGRVAVYCHGSSWRTARRLLVSGLADEEVSKRLTITDKGREFLALRLLP